MRSLFVEGVFDALMERGEHFDGIIGVSAGCLFGCNLKSHQPGRGLRYNLSLIGDKRYISVRSLLTTGNYLNAEFAYSTLPKEYDRFDYEAYSNDPAEFIATCTDIVTGEPVYHRLDTMDDEDMQWMRASASMPIVATPVHIGGRVLMDGGITDSIPLRHMQELGYDDITVVRTQPREYRKGPARFAPLLRFLMPRYPKVAELLAHRYETYNAQVEYLYEQERKGGVHVICPPRAITIGRMEQNADKLKDTYQMGYDLIHNM